MRTITIDNLLVNDDSPCFVIAEVGHNHQGSVEKAIQLIRAAKDCGASAVKLQKRDNKSLYTREMYNSPYDNENSYGDTYGEHREALEFGKSQYEELIDAAKSAGITLFATAFDFPSLDFLASLDMPAYKIASADINNVPLLTRIAQVGKPMIVSTGGASLRDVQRAYDTIMPHNTQLSFLQCTAAYPCEPEQMNLRVIATLRDRFPDVVIGESDHQSGIAMALVAYVLGARIIEKHFTLNRAWKGTDQAFSLEPAGLKKLVRDLERARLSMGDGVKRRLDCEEKPLRKMSKMLVAARDVPAGTVLGENDIAIKSPGNGLPPYEMDRVFGRVTTKPLQLDEPITFEVLEGNTIDATRATAQPAVSAS